MSIFNSLGSNYDFVFVIKSLAHSNRLVYHSKLQHLLQKEYDGKTFLLYKGREAIILALRSLKLPIGSYVAINGFTCFAVYEAVKNAGFKVEYLDIGKDDLNFSPETLQKSLVKNSKIKVVIIQNTLGYPCQIEEIAQICKENKIVLIEDLAHSIGTKYSNGSETGTIGDIVVLSFSQDKIIDGISGGALIIRRGVKLIQMEGGLRWHLPKKQLINRLYPLLTYLIRNTYSFGLGKLLHFILKSLKFLQNPMETGNGEIHQLPAWYCNLIKHQFEKSEESLIYRKKIATIYAEEINQNILSTQIKKLIPFSSNLRFPIFVENRDSLINYLKKHGVYVSDIWYDAPISTKRFMKQTNYSEQCPNAELMSKEILNLPTHINVSEKNAKEISHLINQWLKLQ